jgi:catechol 2,3-dioxygenase-like lactoylglutathione lyase family enzyme
MTTQATDRPSTRRVGRDLDAVVSMLFHPTLLVDDLEQAKQWFSKAFGRRGIRWEEKWDFSKMDKSYPVNYSVFIQMGDVMVDVLQPSLLKLPGDAKAPYPHGEGLTDMAFHTNDACRLARTLEHESIRTRDQTGLTIVDGQVPVHRLTLAGDCYTIWTLPEDSGFTYEFMDIGEGNKPFYSETGDPRLRRDWELPAPTASDPLRLVANSHHTILTPNPCRAIDLFTRVLGGAVIASTYDPDWDANAVFVRFAGTVIEFASPRSGALPQAFSSPASDADAYVGMTFVVQDVDRVARHLDAEGVPLETTMAGISTQAEHTFNVRWEFIETTPY